MKKKTKKATTTRGSEINGMGIGRSSVCVWGVRRWQSGLESASMELWGQQLSCWTLTRDRRMSVTVTISCGSPTANAVSSLWVCVSETFLFQLLFQFLFPFRNQVAAHHLAMALSLATLLPFAAAPASAPEGPRVSLTSEARVLQAARPRGHECALDGGSAADLQGIGNGAAGVGRRAALAAAAASAMLFFVAEDSKAADTGLLSKYIKRKKLDPLDTYVPTVLLAQLQFQDVDEKLVGDKPDFADARSLLRNGPAGSLRSDIRAVAQYAAEAGNGKVANEAVDQCLSALEDLDSLLFRASRESGSASVDVMKSRVSTAVTAIDKLLATVPENILEKGKEVATAYREQSTPSNDDALGFDESPDQLKGLL